MSGNVYWTRAFLACVGFACFVGTIIGITIIEKQVLEQEKRSNNLEQDLFIADARLWAAENRGEILKANISSLEGELAQQDIETEALKAKVDILDASIDSTKKRWARVLRVRDAIMDTLPNKHPLCEDRLSPQYILRVAGYLVDFSDQHGSPLALSMAVARRESVFCQAAQSSAGASGIMQLMKETAEEVSRELGVRVRRHKTRDNINGGCFYLSKMLIEFDGNEELAVKAYNMGPHNVRKVLAGELSDYYRETREYWDAVSRYRAEFEEMGL